MRAKRLTDVGIERLAHPPAGRLEIWDALAPGLGVRVGTRRKSFFVMTRVDGRLRRVTIGSHPGMTIKQAREKARRAAALARNGEDPVEHERAQREKRRTQRKETVAATVDDYIESYAKPRLRSWKDTEGRLRNHLVTLYGERPVSSLTRADIVLLLDEAVARGLTTGANRVLANTKTYLDWCVERGLIERSPAERVRAPMKEVARDRVLTDDELKAVWKAADDAGYPFGPIVQLLILTGQRRDEVARLAWDELDLKAATWTIPAEKNKSARPHAVPLSESALEIIHAIPRVGCLLFPSQADPQGDRPFSGWSRAKRRLDAASEAAGWRLHDLRRTAASGMARLGVEPHVVERVLNHATTSAGPLARVYQRYEYETEKREALEAWGDLVRRRVSKEQYSGENCNRRS